MQITLVYNSQQVTSPGAAHRETL